MSTRCPACGEFIGDNTFGKSAQHKCGAVINWNAVELASTDPRDAEIARLNALLAEAREGLEMCERNDRSEPYGYANKGAPEASYRRAGDGAIPEVGKRWKTPREIARAILAKLGA